MELTEYLVAELDSEVQRAAGVRSNRFPTASTTGSRTTGR